ncbi:hypothetical protein FF38_03142 [Lucilia cuprina]|uniref:Uncharacterized protein n=1 Tax=Lucilia cuprina TaxID=7375 RepID=A0A0L0CNB7_LUCCU|nr:hypothetical protein FF38_03142 [Lucilia cuprina]
MEGATRTIAILPILSKNILMDDKVAHAKFEDSNCTSFQDIRLLMAIYGLFYPINKNSFTLPKLLKVTFLFFTMTWTLGRPGGHTSTTIPSKRSSSDVVVTLKRASSSLDGDVNSSTSFLKLSSASFTSSAQLNSGISSGSISGFVSGSNGGNSIASSTGVCFLSSLLFDNGASGGGEHAECNGCRLAQNVRAYVSAS